MIDYLCGLISTLKSFRKEDIKYHFLQENSEFIEIFIFDEKPQILII